MPRLTFHNVLLIDIQHTVDILLVRLARAFPPQAKSHGVCDTQFQLFTRFVRKSWRVCVLMELVERDGVSSSVKDTATKLKSKKGKLSVFDCNSFTITA